MNKRRRFCAIFASCVFQAIAGQGSRAAEFIATVTDGDGKPVVNAIVYLDSPVASTVPLAPKALAVIDQINKEFVPRTVAVALGSSVVFPNKDDIHHHVYSFSDAKKFELPLYQGTPTDPVLFDKPGVVTLGCNIHDWMRGYILVLATPYFVATAADGVADLQDIPAGGYSVKVWHPDIKQGVPVAGDDVTLAAGAEAKQLIQLDLKPALRIRRAPVGRRSERY